MPFNAVIFDVQIPLTNIGLILKTSTPTIARALMTSGEAVLVPRIKAHLRLNKNVFRGQVISRVAARGAVVSGNPAIDLGVHGTNYAYILHEGSGPRVVSDREFRKLIDYAKKKLKFRATVPKRRVRRGGRLTRFTVDAETVARAIKNTIQTEGNKPHPYIVPVFNANESRFVADVTKRIKANLGT